MTSTTSHPRHPAKYTDSLIPVMRKMLNGVHMVLDPFAGTGKIFEVGVNKTFAIEIEMEWARMRDGIIVADALKLPFKDSFFDAVCTSPCYGNRMADSFNSKDGSYRNTYHHALGRKPHSNSAATLQWGKRYRSFHLKAWQEVRRVLKPNGVFVLNIKDHFRNGVLQGVPDWHNSIINKMGFLEKEKIYVEVPSNKFGKNRDLRMNKEVLYKFIKLQEAP